MIHRYSLEMLGRWNRGELPVQVLVPGNDRPVAYCDGTPEDEAELRAIAEDEGTELPAIHKKLLKSGRQTWTVGAAPAASAPAED